MPNLECLAVHRPLVTEVPAVWTWKTTNPRGRLHQRLASASTMEAKIFQPSDDPSSRSLDRSGWGIIPSTFLPAFRIPAMLLSEPLGFASLVISPLLVE